MNIMVKNISEQQDKRDGIRVLVTDYLPEGMDKSTVHSDVWPKDIAPSTKLRDMLISRTVKWEEFEKAYFRELDERDIWMNTIFKIAQGVKITLLYVAGDPERNSAVAVRDYLLAKEKEELRKKAA